jgi:hypothetical protein
LPNSSREAAVMALTGFQSAMKRSHLGMPPGSLDGRTVHALTPN